MGSQGQCCGNTHLIIIIKNNVNFNSLTQPVGYYKTSHSSVHIPAKEEIILDALFAYKITNLCRQFIIYM